MTKRRRTPVRAGRAVATSGAGARVLVDARELKKLAVLMEESGLVELELETGGERVRLVRGRVGAVAPASGDAVPAQAGAAGPEAALDAGARTITSPLVGIFHRAATPDDVPFVEVGDVVERGQVLCFVEAMQMMNEIEAELRGRVVRILVENGRPIEYGEPLFLVEPV